MKILIIRSAPFYEIIRLINHINLNFDQNTEISILIQPDQLETFNQIKKVLNLNIETILFEKNVFFKYDNSLNLWISEINKKNFDTVILPYTNKTGNNFEELEKLLLKLQIPQKYTVVCNIQIKKKITLNKTNFFKMLFMRLIKRFLLEDTILKLICIKSYFQHIKVADKNFNLTPPLKMIMYVGSHNYNKFYADADKIVKQFIDFCSLEKDADILDIASGVGKHAIPLLNHLNKNGSYNGFDLYKEGIEWCSKNITSRFNNFKFTHINLYNKFYNINGDICSSNFVFPYSDNKFDGIISVSLFTHLLPEDMDNYLREISRTLKKNGKAYLTFFILDTNRVKYIEKGISAFNFKYKGDNYYCIDEQYPERAIAYDEEYVKNKLLDNNLELVEIKKGFWCFYEYNIDFQDILIVKKT